MSRKKRILVVGEAHHIFEESCDHEAVFLEHQDYHAYLRLLKAAKSRFQVRVHGWCLLPNAAHLLLRPMRDAGDLSCCIQYVQRRYSQDFNQRYGRDGPLWQGRFRSALVEPGQWLLADLRYMELLPVMEGLTHSVSRYRWSSHGARMRGGPDGLIDFDASFLQLGPDLSSRREAFRELLTVGCEARERERIEAGVKRNQYIGSRAYADQLETLTGERIHFRGRGRPSKK
ncbi:transposase IS200-like protein [Alcanivorax xiamenensis]|uniref:Transposase IS200-like protein n=1 Tax=Alcanivorax xiamenensis TaxID=1177156 RepID=A0ABQ6Y307_9GAMM|nr:MULTISPECIES: transposase [Alcanivorax]KAF0802822.1 transposase IS200-like protein [Alcanivorax xiamenensis]